MRSVRLLAVVTLALTVAVLTISGGLWGDITGFFGGVIGSVGDAIKSVLRAVRSVVDFFGRLGQLAFSAWDWVVNGVEWLGDRAARLGGSVLNIGRWIVERWVPMAVHWALGKAAALALGLYNTVRKFVVGLVNGVIKWATGALHTLEHWAAGVFRIVWKAIASAATWIRHATFYVFDLVAHPDRLASWLAAHIIEPVIRWLVNAGAGVIRWIVKNTVHLALEFADVLERAVAGIF